ncbi:hypothetical protein Pcinc_018795 [Petrolisthes cinctipes]|uniref:Uncharacterized protein n=1 Tax=Petrolisthes cinctipes TaxID=88211 RepID=A0AAE1FMZ7_PETCI|nr:hypothetical protein Pcinc_018795 [Petrolisthes cinctipes]
MLDFIVTIRNIQEGKIPQINKDEKDTSEDVFQIDESMSELLEMIKNRQGDYIQRPNSDIISVGMLRDYVDALCDEEKLEFLNELRSDVKNQYHFLLGREESVETDDDEDSENVGRGNDSNEEDDARRERSEPLKEDDDEDDDDIKEEDETDDKEREENRVEPHSNLHKEMKQLKKGAEEEKKKDEEKKMDVGDNDSGGKTDDESNWYTVSTEMSMNDDSDFDKLDQDTSTSEEGENDKM